MQKKNMPVSETLFLLFGEAAVSLAVAGGVILLVLRRKKKSADKSA